MPVTDNATPAGIWLRVSTTGQDEDSQLPDIMAWVQSHGYDAAAQYEVHGGSAFKGNRKFDTTWAQVLEDMKSGKIRVLVVWKQDRLDRKLNTFQMLSQVLDAGGRVEFVTQPHLNDLTTMGGRIALKVQEEIAYAESKDKSDRVRIKHDALRAADSLIGRAPWGFEVVTLDGGRKTLQPTAEGRRLVPGVFERVCKGESLAKVARWLETETGRPWWPRTIGHMIRTGTYMGFRTDAEGRTVLRCEYLVDAATWKRANSALDNRPKKGPSLGHRAMLTSILSCPRCEAEGRDSPMYRVHADQGFSYRCWGRGPSRKGCGNMLPLELADAMVCHIAEHVLCWEKVTETRFTPGHNHEPELEAVRFELEQLPKRRLPWEQEDAERARLRAEHDRLKDLPCVPDTWEEVELDRTYADVWSELEAAERGSWLREHGFRVQATRASLTLTRTLPGPAQGVTRQVAWTVTPADLEAASMGQAA